MLYLFEEYKINLWRVLMKKQKLLGVFLISTIILCGCAQMEKDTSYDTDLYGTYSWTISAPEISFESKSTYKINEDNTYEIISSDNTWEVTSSTPVLMADFYDGETYDANLEFDKLNYHKASYEKLKINPKLLFDYGASVVPKPCYQYL